MRREKRYKEKRHKELGTWRERDAQGGKTRGLSGRITVFIEVLLA